MPFVFTEHGIAMLSSILNSDRAIKVNISIIRIFIKLRKLLSEDESLSEKVYKIEKESGALFKIIFEKLGKLEEETPILPRKRKK